MTELLYSTTPENDASGPEGLEIDAALAGIAKASGMEVPFGNQFMAPSEGTDTVQDPVMTGGPTWTTVGQTQKKDDGDNE